MKHPLSSRCLLCSLLTLQALLLAWGAYRHSPTLNEPAHLAAGLSHWKFGRFELYRVNPPLVRMVAALPVLAANPQTDWTRFHESPGARPTFGIGQEFIAANGERSFFLMTLARWTCIPLSLWGGFVCYCWARELHGNVAGILALCLWIFSPNLITHGQFITPDMGATALGLTAAYTFWRWLSSPGWMRALVAGLCLGLAVLTKLTWIVLFGLWPVLWLLWSLMEPKGEHRTTSRLHQVSQLATLIVIALYLLNLGYGFEGSFTRLRDYQFVSKSLTLPVDDQSASFTGRGSNRYADSWIGKLPVPFPKNYLTGIDIQKKDFENFSRPSYLRGNFQEKGWWYYYLYGLGVKVPLGTWLLGLLAICSRFTPTGRSVPLRNDLILLAPALCVLALVSSQTGFNHHLRYVLLILPFVFIWISRIACYVDPRNWKVVLPACAALVWSITSSLSVYPHSLSYFNELGGGPRGGHAHLINSNIDWGQDLIYLQDWIQQHPEADSLYLAYYGEIDPRIVGIQFELPPLRPPNAESNSESEIVKPGWYAVSVNYLRGFPWRAPDGKGALKHLPQDSLSYLRSFHPQATVGYSIYLYHLTEEDVSQFE